MYKVYESVHYKMTLLAKGEAHNNMDSLVPIISSAAVVR